jgi:hypothetical protein
VFLPGAKRNARQRPDRRHAKRFLNRKRRVIDLAVQRTQIRPMRRKAKRTGVNPPYRIHGRHHFEQADFVRGPCGLKSAPAPPLRAHQPGAAKRIQNLGKVIERYPRVRRHILRGMRAAPRQRYHGPESVLGSLRKHVKTIIRYPDNLVRIFFALLLPTATLAAATLQLPRGNQRLVSPDGVWLLYARQQQPQLWLENLRTHLRKRVQAVPDTLRAGWFPDGRQFWVEDHSASDQTDTYICNPATLRRLDVRRIVLGADPAIGKLDEGHRYYNVESPAAGSLLIDFRGHTDIGPVDCFNIRYRVTRAGKVEKLSGRVWPIQPFPKGCQ